MHCTRVPVLFAALFTPLWLYAHPPAEIHYQGKILVDDLPSVGHRVLPQMNSRADDGSPGHHPGRGHNYFPRPWRCRHD